MFPVTFQNNVGTTTEQGTAQVSQADLFGASWTAPMGKDASLLGVDMRVRDIAAVKIASTSLSLDLNCNVDGGFVGALQTARTGAMQAITADTFKQVCGLAKCDSDA